MHTIRKYALKSFNNDDKQQIEKSINLIFLKNLTNLLSKLVEINSNMHEHTQKMCSCSGSLTRIPLLVSERDLYFTVIAEMTANTALYFNSAGPGTAKSNQLRERSTFVHTASPLRKERNVAVEKFESRKYL